MKTTKRSKFVALAVGLALVAAACGDNKKSSTTDAAPETTAAAATPTTAAGVTETTAGGTATTDTTGTGTTDTTAGTGKAAMKVTYTLSDKAVWEDGSDITVADFKCTLDAVMNTPGSLSTTGYDQILSVEKGKTAKEVVTTFKTKYAPWKGLFSGLLKAANFKDCNDVSQDFDKGISFSGREWKIDTWTKEQLVLVPNPGYTGSKVPGVKRIVVVPADDGPTALKSGAVDFIFPQAHTGIDKELADPNVDSKSALSGSFEAFYFQSLKGPFADPVFRQAFSESIDTAALYKQIYEPFAVGTPLLDCGPVSPGPYCDHAFAKTYDPTDAEKVLTAAGWKKDGSGMWADKTGKVPEIRWMVNTGNTRRESTQEFLIPKMAAAGFKVKADNCEAIPCVFQTRLPSLDYDMAMYISTVAPDPSYLSAAFTCDQIPSDKNGNKGQNNTGWCNQKATDLLKASDAELDEAKRATDVKGAIALMATDHILLPLLQFPNVGAIRKDKVGNAYGELANYRAINDWYQWKDVDGDGQIVIGAEQFPPSDCANPVTECANSSWFTWLISDPVLPGAYDTTNDQKFVPTEMLKGEAVLEVL